MQQPGRRLEETKQQPGLGRARAIQEVQTERRLADTRGTDQGRDGRLRQPTSEHGIQCVDTDR